MSQFKTCVLVNSLAGGGAEKVVATLIPEYQKAGARPSLLCLEQNDFFVIEGVTPVFLSSQTGGDEGGIKKLISLFTFALKLKKHVRENQLQLVQSHIYRSNYVNVLARLLGSKHKVQIVNHGIPGQYRNEGLAGKINLLLIKWLYPRADQVICPSQGMIDEFVLLGVPREKLQLIRNPFDLEDLRSQAQKQMLAGEFEFEPEKQYLVCVGRLQAVKRFEDVIWAFYQLQKNNSEAFGNNIELLILGEGEKHETLAALCMRLAIGKKVHLLGLVKNPHKYLARADVLVSASEFEGFSNVIVEALAAGVPVLSTDCESGPREILSPGTSRQQPIAPGAVEKVQHGLMVPVGDIKALVKGMSRLLDDFGMREQFSASGKARVEEFSKETIAGIYLSYSNALMGETP